MHEVTIKHYDKLKSILQTEIPKMYKNAISFLFCKIYKNKY